MSSSYRQSFSVIDPTVIPLIVSDDLIRITKGSIAKANNPGDKGHPCLVLLHREIVDERILLVLTLAEGFLYNCCIQETNLGRKPNLSRTRQRNSHSTELKAFSASREATTPWDPVLVA